MTVRSWGGLIALTLIVVVANGCNKQHALFTQTRQFARRPRDPATVAVYTSRPPDSVAMEVGFITARTSNFEDSLFFAHQEAARQGCDGLLVIGEAIEGNTGMIRGAHNLRASCLVRTGAPAYAPAAAPPPPPALQQAPLPPPGEVSAPPVVANPAPPVVANCAPRCRSGFDCRGGQCVSSCNPPCPTGRVCQGHDETAQCVVEAPAEGVPASP